MYPYDNHSLSAIELGASIFVNANYNLMRAAEEFGLELKDFKSDEFDGMGVRYLRAYILFQKLNLHI